MGLVGEGGSSRLSGEEGRLRWRLERWQGGSLIKSGGKANQESGMCNSPEVAHSIQEPRLDSASGNGGGGWFEC